MTKPEPTTGLRMAPATWTICEVHFTGKVEKDLPSTDQSAAARAADALAMNYIAIDPLHPERYMLTAEGNAVWAQLTRDVRVAAGTVVR